MVREVKRAAFRECWVHICFRFDVTGHSCGRRRLRRRSFWLLMSDAAAHRGAPLFEVGDLSTEKGDAGIGGRQVPGQNGEPRRFAGPLPCRD